jgi:hypothetical protein
MPVIFFMESTITLHDRRERHCPMLGHELTFSYCRAPAADIPCRRIFDCWWERFDIRAFMQEHYSEEIIAKVRAAPASKATSILELIQQAKRVAGSSSND